MSPRSACGWPEWEEKNLLSWLDAHRDLSWKALSDAYYEEYQVDRSVESLRGKKYHILRMQRLAPKSPVVQANKSDQATCGARWSIAVHGQLCQTIPLSKGTLTSGFKQF
ncbi:hypothetical protein PENNAL_c0406G03655 [Penicillium nalgiovense]|uniref:Uncharacterized protein n=1 Tax=Penicillium nalgiovense TaxID=60175 RepID=A0A1V6W1E6_PENNA|nr:hypothetical protein PENNAL_c0406G03655 [Penicillium nalgiovense]